jgi:transposase
VSGSKQVLSQNPLDGAVFAFRNRSGGLIKLLWHDGIGLCLLTKRLEKGRFVWPMTSSGAISLTTAQLATLLEGCEWRAPVTSRRPELVG